MKGEIGYPGAPGVDGEKGEEFVLTRAGVVHRGDLFSCSSDGSPAHHHAHWSGPENH